MSGQNALLQYFPKLSEQDRPKALFNAFLLFLAFTVAGVGILWGLRGSFFEYFNNQQELPYFELLCWYTLLNTPAFLIHIFYLLLKKYKLILWWGAFTFGGQLLAVVLPILFGYSLQMTFWALFALAGIRIGWTLLLLMRHGECIVDIKFIKKYVWLVLPLMLHVLIGNSVEYIDGLIVQANFSDKGAFAVFRFGARELPISLLFVGAVIAALIPQVSQNQEQGLQLIKQKTDELSRWLYPLSILLMLLSPLLFPIFYSEEFAESAYIFNVYLLMLSSRILMPQIIIMSHQKNFILVNSAIIETLINVGLSLLLVKYYGLIGIAFASVIAYLIDKLILIIYNALVLKIPVQHYTSLKKYFFYNTLLVGSFFLTQMLYK